MKLRHLTTSALALILMSACSDSTGVGVEPDDLAGVWTATAMVFTSVADSEVSVDAVAEGVTLTLTIVDDGTYSAVFTDPEEAPETESGSYVVSGSTLTITPTTGVDGPQSFTIARDGDTMTMTASDEEFAFGADDIEEAATLLITLTR